MGRPSEETARTPVGGAVAALAAEILKDARTAFETPGRSDAVAVHDFRKAMKRWRALLRLVKPTVGGEAERLRVVARDLARDLAAARDGQAALDAFADLLKGDTGLSPRTVTTITGRLEALRTDAESTSLTEETRARVADALDEAAAALADWPFDDMKFFDLAAALTTGYRRARKAIPDDWAEADAEEVHDLRRCVVVHRYQMDLAVPLWPRFGKLWVGEAQRLRDRLGTCQDIAMLEGLMAPHGPLTRWRHRLAPLVAARRAVHVAAASRLAARLFAEKPRAFRRRLLALGESAHDAD